METENNTFLASLIFVIVLTSGCTTIEDVEVQEIDTQLDFDEEAVYIQGSLTDYNQDFDLLLEDETLEVGESGNFSSELDLKSPISKDLVLEEDEESLVLDKISLTYEPKFDTVSVSEQNVSVLFEPSIDSSHNYSIINYKDYRGTSLEDSKYSFELYDIEKVHSSLEGSLDSQEKTFQYLIDIDSNELVEEFGDKLSFEIDIENQNISESETVIVSDFSSNKTVNLSEEGDWISSNIETEIIDTESDDNIKQVNRTSVNVELERDFDTIKIDDEETGLESEMNDSDGSFVVETEIVESFSTSNDLIEVIGDLPYYNTDEVALIGVDYSLDEELYPPTTEEDEDENNSINTPVVQYSSVPFATTSVFTWVATLGNGLDDVIYDENDFRDDIEHILYYSVDSEDGIMIYSGSFTKDNIESSLTDGFEEQDSLHSFTIFDEDDGSSPVSVSTDYLVLGGGIESHESFIEAQEGERASLNEAPEDYIKVLNVIDEDSDSFLAIYGNNPEVEEPDYDFEIPQNSRMGFEAEFSDIKTNSSVLIDSTDQLDRKEEIDITAWFEEPSIEDHALITPTRMAYARLSFDNELFEQAEE